MLEFKSRVLKFKLNDEEFKLNYPTVHQVKEYDKNLKKVGDEGSLDVIIDFLQSLGLDSKATDQLEPDHLLEIIKEISGQKKS